MSVQVEMLEKNMAKLTIDVPADEFEKAITRAYNKNKGQISIPGFRKGKVPQVLVEKMYGPAIFYEEAANYVMPEAYEKAAEESKLDIVSRPAIDVTQMEKGKDFIFTAEVAVKPEVTLGEYKGIEVEKTQIEVTDEEVDAEIKKTQEQNSREITVDRPAENGDTVVIDYAGTIDGNAFDGGSDKGHSLVLGSNTFIPGFEDQLIGATADSDVEVHVTFPEDYHAKDLAGKEAVFACHVHEVKTKEYPEIDDEFAQDVSEFDTLAEYKEDVKKHITERKENQAKAEKQQKVMDKVIENATMDIPDAMVDTQAANMVEEYAQRLSYQGLSMDQYFKFTGMNAETLKEQLKPQALKNIQSRLVLEAVIAAENIEVSDEEFDKEIEKMASMYQMEVDKVKELLGDAEKENIKNDLAAQKAVEFVTDAAVEK
ncbi:trigger factor [Catenibacillus scindens]|uniref:Trigger factor n=1 Tax=Catenibacillus scindens TaxID=673271 RepID=A0A7W8H7Q3_9FIRM|nr:trigger factor [Catenibacillus scindens]MBB5263278.1 trigger factor [Catenibacillus scindens]